MLMQIQNTMVDLNENPKHCTQAFQQALVQLVIVIIFILQISLILSFKLPSHLCFNKFNLVKVTLNLLTGKIEIYFD